MKSLFAENARPVSNETIEVGILAPESLLTAPSQPKPVDVAVCSSVTVAGTAQTFNLVPH